MTTWFTSDHHFGHQNIIKYCDRPFDSVEEMNEVMIARWNDVVGTTDRVFVLGDFALGKISETLPLAERLNGNKYLIPGNHDRVFPGSKRDKWIPVYVAAGFEIGPMQRARYMTGGHWAVLSHLPYEGDSHDEDRFEAFRPIDEGLPLLHGHVHDKWRLKGRQLNVGVDVWDFYPVHEETIIDILFD